MMRFRIRWTKNFKMPGTGLRGRYAVIASGMSFMLPVLIAAAIDDLPTGLTISAGALVIGTGQQERDVENRLHHFSALSVIVALALAVAFAATHRGWITDAAITMAAGLAAALAGFSRRAASLAVRFILCLTIGAAVLDTTTSPAMMALLMMAGTLWALLAGALVAALLPASPDSASDFVDRPASNATFRAKITRWRRTMSEASGWHYVMRITAGLAAAGIVRTMWPDHHFFWIAITVVLLTDWRTDWPSGKSLQRVVGTCIAIAAIGLFFLLAPSAWVIGVLVGLLGSLRPLASAMGYVAYSTVTTLLILIIVDRGAPPPSGILLDRLIATVVGAAIVLSVSLIVWRLLELCPRLEPRKDR